MDYNKINTHIITELKLLSFFYTYNRSKYV